MVKDLMDRPFVVASTQPPYQPPGPAGPGGWGPSGPVGPGGPPGPGEPPPFGPPPGGPPPWQPPPPPGPMGPMGPGGPPPKRNLTPIIVAIVAFVVVVGLAVLALVLIPKLTNKSSNATGTTTTATTTTTTSSTESTTSSKTRTTTSKTTSPGQTGASARLMSLLPKGYDSGVCKPIEPVTDALATVDCKQNSNPGGPEIARYSLFADQQTLDDRFEAAIKEDDELVSCPGSNADSPTEWHYTSTPDKVEGQVACGSYQGKPDVVWTRNEDLLLGDGQGPDLDALHQWWLKYG